MEHVLTSQELIVSQSLKSQLQEITDFSERMAHTLDRLGNQGRSMAREAIEVLSPACKDYEEHIQRLRITLAALPSELKKRPFIQEASRQISEAVAAFSAMIPKASQAKLDAWSHSVDASLAGMQARLAEIKNQIARLKDNALVQKFLAGEIVLSSAKTVQWWRKIAHAGLGLLAVWLYLGSGLSHAQNMALFALFIVPCLTLETLRFLRPDINQMVWRRFRWVMREREKGRINSAMYYMFTMYAVCWIFDRNIAVLTFLCVALGDPMASLVGVHWGKRKFLHGTASIAGTLACFVTCFLCCLSLIGLDPTFQGSYLLFAVLGGAIAASGELMFPKLDDNLVMPIVTSTGLYALYAVMA